MFRTPKRNKLVLINDNVTAVTPPDRILKPRTFNSVDKGPVNGSLSSGGENVVLSPGETRRGRPRAEILNTLILEGSTSPSSIKCTYCSRVFPREKSLQAHLRTHTGEKPYVCDYPRCTRKFAQSGQLKTHQRLHTGEKPFICSSQNCERRFTHANRHCPEHPDLQLKRFTTTPISNIEKKFDEAHNAEVREWLKNVDKRNKRSLNTENFETTPKKSKFKKEESLFESSNSCYFTSLSQTSLADDIIDSPKSELDDNDMSTCSNSDSFENEMQINENSCKIELPKKRWLREAVQDQQLWDSNQDLAQPINWGEEVTTESDDVAVEPESITRGRYIEIEPEVIIENQKRPTVLVRVQDGKSKQITSDDVQGAIALVELKNGQTQCVNFKYRI